MKKRKELKMIVDTTVKIELPYSKEFLPLFNALSQNCNKTQVWQT